MINNRISFLHRHNFALSNQSNDISSINFQTQKRKRMSTVKNRVTLIGRLGMAPELKTVGNGYQLARFSLATNERSKTKTGEYKTQTEWHSIVVWGKLAETAAKLLQKGSEVVVNGRLKYSDFKNKSGDKVIRAEVEISDFELLSSRPKEANENEVTN